MVQTIRRIVSAEYETYLNNVSTDQYNVKVFYKRLYKLQKVKLWHKCTVQRFLGRKTLVPLFFIGLRVP